eukprot:GHVL01009577.1.p1 GENE.GHVL01009577.1~~GHVL01009577.1.p1  ORF type:complete len:519 (-),score=87.55 GHVL01009577.1:527-2083(-)
MFIETIGLLSEYKTMSVYPPSVQQVYLLACMKAMAGLASNLTEEKMDEINDLFEKAKNCAANCVRSTNAEVSSRALLAHIFYSLFNNDWEGLASCSMLWEEELPPVHFDAQNQLQIPPDLDLDTPFFPSNSKKSSKNRAKINKDAFKVDYNILPTYEDDLGFSRKSFTSSLPPSKPENDPSRSLYYLKQSDNNQSSRTSVDDTNDPVLQKSNKFDLLTQQMAVSNTHTAQINRADLLPTRCDEPPQLPPVSKKDVSSWDLRQWTEAISDEHLKVFYSLRGRIGNDPDGRACLRVEFVCENLNPTGGELGTISLEIAELMDNAENADITWSKCVVLSELLQHRSAKCSVSVFCPNIKDVTCLVIPCRAKYGEKIAEGRLNIPLTRFLTPWITNNDEVARFMSDQNNCSARSSDSTELSIATDDALQILRETLNCTGAYCGFSLLCGPSTTDSQKFILASKFIQSKEVVLLRIEGKVEMQTIQLRWNVGSNDKTVSDGVSEAFSTELRKVLTKMVQQRSS